MCGNLYSFGEPLKYPFAVDYIAHAYLASLSANIIRTLWGMFGVKLRRSATKLAIPLYLTV